MKTIKIFIFLLLAVKSYAQVKMTGQVADEKSHPVSYVTIEIIGTNVTATTDDLGTFVLTLPNKYKNGDNVTLRVSKSGYKIATRLTPVTSLSIPIKLINDPKSKVTSLPIQQEKKDAVDQSQKNTHEINKPTFLVIFKVVVLLPDRLLSRRQLES